LPGSPSEEERPGRITRLEVLPPSPARLGLKYLGSRSFSSIYFRQHVLPPLSTKTIPPRSYKMSTSVIFSFSRRICSCWDNSARSEGLPDQISPPSHRQSAFAGMTQRADIYRGSLPSLFWLRAGLCWDNPARSKWTARLGSLGRRNVVVAHLFCRQVWDRSKYRDLLTRSKCRPGI
jgi:hypothetical protein